MAVAEASKALAAKAPAPSKVEWLRSENVRLRSQLAQALLDIESRERTLAALNGFKDAKLSPPVWLSPKHKKKSEHGIASVLFSDWHFDEVVSLEEVSYVNCYNRQIAELRLEKFFRNVIRLSFEYMNGVYLDGLVFAMGGDIVSGLIHEELEESNDDRILPTCLYWSERIAAGLEMLLEHFPHIYVPCVVGNHGRLYRKPRYKHRAQDNYDWLIYKLLERHFKGNPKIKFDVSPSSEARWNVYGTRYQMTHGDQFRGGGGIGGLSVPIIRGDAKKRKVESATKRPYDILLLGHWHQYRDLDSIIINGSGIGANEFSLQNNLDFELPRQAFWLTDPVHGKTICAPVRVLDPDRERWVDESPIKDMLRG